jgi:hypothetical protein
LSVPIDGNPDLASIWVVSNGGGFLTLNQSVLTAA